MKFNHNIINVVAAVITIASVTQVAWSGELLCGTTVLGVISTEGERDEFTFEVNAGDALFARVSGETPDFGPKVELYDPNGKELLLNLGGSASTEPVEIGGTYTVFVRWWNGSSRTGNYALTIVSAACGTPFWEPQLRSDGGFRSVLRDAPGSKYQIELSADLVNWEPFKDITMEGLEAEFVDTTARSAQARFYRARRLP